MKKTNRMKWGRVVVGVTVALLAAGCGKPGGMLKREMPPQDVGVVTLVQERAEIVTELPGRTAAFRVAEVRPQVSGIILKRFFEEGSEVKEGEQLYQIDPARYQAAFDSAKATLEKSEAVAELASVLAERRNKLATTSVISKQDRDDAVAGLKEASAGVSAAKAALETAQINLQFTKVLAPIAGRIGRSSVTEGALVTEGQPMALATVYQLDPIYVDVTQSSVERLRLQKQFAQGALKDAKAREAQARLILEDGTVYQYPGKLQFSEVNVDKDTGSVALRAVFPNPDHTLLPGMFVRALITEGMRDNAILVSQRGVTHNAKGQATALVVDAENKVEPRVVEVDRVFGDRWLVTEGLQAGDRVIVEGLQKIRPGAVVVPSEVKQDIKKSSEEK